MQNNVRELWSLFDWLSQVSHGTPPRTPPATHPTSSASHRSPHATRHTLQGSLLGGWLTFKKEFAEPIERSRHADASGIEQEVGRARANELRDLVQPYILQRTKADYLVSDETATANTDEHANGNNNSSDDGNGNGTTHPKSGGGGTNSSAGGNGTSGTNGTVVRTRGAAAAISKTLPPKRELVLWVGLTTIQRSVYEEYLAGEEVHQVRTGSRRSPLAAISHLKKCTASALLVRERQYNHQDQRYLAAPEDKEKRRRRREQRRQEQQQRRRDREASAANQVVKATMRFGADTDTATDSTDSDSDSDSGMEAGGASDAGGMSWEVTDLPPPSELVAQSGKLCVLLSLLDRFKSEGHRSLVFSQSVRMLNMVERCVREYECTSTLQPPITLQHHSVAMLQRQGLPSCNQPSITIHLRRSPTTHRCLPDTYRCLRLDGSVPHDERAARVETFQEDSSHLVMLLTTQVPTYLLQIAAPLAQSP